MKKFIEEHKYLIAIILGGIVLRLWHIGWGLPGLYEEATPMHVALKFWNWNQPGLSFNPHFFNYPALTFYIHFAVQAIHYGIGYLFGAYPDLSSFGSNLPALVIMARLISVFFDIANIVALYFFAKLITTRNVGLIAAALAALNPSLIRHAHMIQVDTPLTFFCIMALMFLYRMFLDRQSKWYYLAGIAIGCAASAKYTGALLLLAMVGIHMMREKSIAKALQSLQDPRLYATIAIAGALFLLLNPYIILNYQEFRDGFTFEQQHIAFGHLGVDASQSTSGYYMSDIFPAVFGWGLFLVIIGTVVYFFFRKDKSQIFLLIFPVIYFIIVSTWEMRAERYILPLIPVMILIGSIGLVAAWEQIKKFVSSGNAGQTSHPSLVKIGVFVIICLLILIEPISGTYRYLKPLGLPDTRALTREWIKQHLPAGSVIATGPYGVDFPEDQYFTLHIPFLGFEAERVAPFYDARWYEDVDLLITSDYDYSRYANEPQRYGEFLAYYDSLRTRWKHEMELQPSGDKTGPSFWLYSYPDSLRKPLFDPLVFKRLEAAPESSRISNFLKDLNTVLLRKGKLQKSEQVLREILAVEVENVPLRNMLSQVLVNLGKYEAALSQLQQSLQFKPDQPEVFALAGHALVQLKKYREAEQTLNKAISLNPKIESPYIDLIRLYSEKNEKVNQAAILKQYLRILPANSTRAKEIQQQLDKIEGKR